jgi:hypothetical protein
MRRFGVQPMSDRGQSTGTVATEGAAAQGLPTGPPDSESGSPWPRLLDLRMAARYTGLSYWTCRDLVAAGVLRAVRVPAVRVDRGPRPNRKPGSKSRVYELAKKPTGNAVRRLLVDRLDLDRLVAEWKEAAV